VARPRCIARFCHGIGIINRYLLSTLSDGLPLGFAVVCFDAELPVGDSVCFLISIVSFHLISDIDWIFGITIKFVVFV